MTKDDEIMKGFLKRNIIYILGIIIFLWMLYSTIDLFGSLHEYIESSFGTDLASLYLFSFAIIVYLSRIFENEGKVKIACLLNLIGGCFVFISWLTLILVLDNSLGLMNTIFILVCSSAVIIKDGFKLFYLGKKPFLKENQQKTLGAVVIILVAVLAILSIFGNWS